MSDDEDNELVAATSVCDANKHVAELTENSVEVDLKKCQLCSEFVFLIEKVAVTTEEVFHRKCFICFVCQQQLNQANFYHSDNNDNCYYCETCFLDKFEHCMVNNDNDSHSETALSFIDTKEAEVLDYPSFLNPFESDIENETLGNTSCQSSLNHVVCSKSNVVSLKKRLAPKPPSVSKEINTLEGLDCTDKSISCSDSKTVCHDDRAFSEEKQEIIPKTIKLKTKRPAPLRPSAIRREWREMSIHDIDATLKIVENKLVEIEKQGTSLEKMIRFSTLKNYLKSKNNDNLLRMLSEVINEKKELIKQQAELEYLKKEYDLQQKQFDLEFQIRLLMNVPKTEKTIKQHEEEDQLIKKLLKIVHQRNNLVETLENCGETTVHQNNATLKTKTLKFKMLGKLKKKD